MFPLRGRLPIAHDSAYVCNFVTYDTRPSESVVMGLFHVIGKQLQHPRGVLGKASLRWMTPKTIEHARWTADLMDVQPNDRVLEVGFGNGANIGLLAERASSGHVDSGASQPAPHSLAAKRLLALLAAAWFALSASAVSAQELPDGVRWPVTNLPGPTRTVSLIGTPTLVVGSAEGPEEHLLSGVVGATLLPDGGLAVADGSLQRILFFDASGQLRRIVGRDGDGPAEFRFLRWLGRCTSGGVMGAFNGAPPSLTLLSYSADSSNRRPLPSQLSFQQPLGCLHPDTLLFALEGPTTALPPGRSSTEPTAVVREIRGRDLDTLASGRGRTYYFSRRMPGAYADVPLRPTTLAAVGTSRLFVVESGSDSIRALDLRGIHRSTLVLGLRRAESSQAHWEHSVRERRSREPLQRTRLIVDSVLAELAPPRELPMIADIATDFGDRIWVKTFDNYLTPFATWLVISPAGRQVARVLTPGTLRPLEIGSGYLIGVLRNVDDVESVALFRFQPLPPDQ